MTVSPPQTSARTTAGSLRRWLAPWLAPAALAASLTGCATGELRTNLSEAKTGIRVHFAAEKAYLHRGDLFHECCSCPLDFKHGFKNGYRDVALYGDDCCAPPTPPSCYWGCSTDDPCERAERLNCYYDGWAHGAIAAGQDGVAGLNTVPIRNICGGYQTAGIHGPVPYNDPGGFDPYGPPLPPGPGFPGPMDPMAPTQIERGLLEAPVPAPAPIPVAPSTPLNGPQIDREDSVGGQSSSNLLRELLEAETVSDEVGASLESDADRDGTSNDGVPPAGSSKAGVSTMQLGDGFQAVPSSDDGPKVTTLWSSDG
ncbi:hypothetical protein [Alienimonas chondri]|uniref:Uncharacterized protein n=1 Tax=Alienimonas chondri TaxID=2681879 RepID=A0ABX1VDW9_9PLAN|nr:hypothetical protein [Alienimonas chondri]NNJ26277.1 hypothetical protein [Alienimonas chondri]